MIEETNNYRDILRNTLSQRQKANAAYSLRAFARDISISPSRLSEILNERHSLSPRKAQEISERLSLPHEERRYFLDLVLAESPYGVLANDLAKERIKAYRSRTEANLIKEEDFHLISNWYHLAIIELLDVPGFSGDVQWIAKKLGIHSNQVVSSLTKLEQLGIISFEENNLIRVHFRNITHSNVPSKSIRNYHKQILDKAYQSIEDQGIDERDLSAVTIGIRKENLPEIKRMLAQWRTEFKNNICAENEDPDQVYCLSMQFFNLTPDTQH